MNELITRSLKKRDAKLLFSFPEVLMSSFEKEMLSWIRKYVLTDRKLPTVSRLCKQFPNFSAIRSTDPISDIYRECIRRKRLQLAQAFVIKIQSAIRSDDDPGDIFREADSSLNASGLELKSYSTFDRNEYFEKKQFMKFGFSVIDRATGGLGNGELCYIAGNLGSYKTTLIEYVVYRWWLKKHRILFVSNESLPITVFSHLDAIAGKFNPVLLRSSNIQQDVKRKIAAVSRAVSRNGSTYKFGEVIVPSARLLSPGAVLSLAGYLQVDVVVIDGVYLMRPDEGARSSQNWEAMTEVSRALKQGALSLQTRIVGILQRKRSSSEKQTTDDIAYSNAFPQDADIVLSLFSESNAITVELIKNREGVANVGTVLTVDHEVRKIVDTGVSVSDIQEIEV